MVHKAQTLPRPGRRGAQGRACQVVREGGRCRRASTASNAEAVRPGAHRGRHARTRTVRVNWDGKGERDFRLATDEFFMPILVAMELPIVRRLPPLLALREPARPGDVASGRATTQAARARRVARRHAQGERRHRQRPRVGGVRRLDDRRVGQHGRRGDRRPRSRSSAGGRRAATSCSSRASENSVRSERSRGPPLDFARGERAVEPPRSSTMADRPLVLPGAPPREIAIDFEGRRIAAVEGEPIAVALLREGHLAISRSSKYHRPRGAFCFASSCGSCLMRIGGAPDRLACATPCTDGLAVTTQNALPTASRRSPGRHRLGLLARHGPPRDARRRAGGRGRDGQGGPAARGARSLAGPGRAPGGEPARTQGRGLRRGVGTRGASRRRCLAGRWLRSLGGRGGGGRPGARPLPRRWLSAGGGPAGGRRPPRPAGSAQSSLPEVATKI